MTICAGDIERPMRAACGCLFLFFAWCSLALAVQWMAAGAYIAICIAAQGRVPSALLILKDAAVTIETFEYRLAICQIMAIGAVRRPAQHFVFFQLRAGRRLRSAWNNAQINQWSNQIYFKRSVHSFSHGVFGAKRIILALISRGLTGLLQKANASIRQQSEFLPTAVRRLLRLQLMAIGGYLGNSQASFIAYRKAWVVLELIFSSNCSIGQYSAPLIRRNFGFYLKFIPQKIRRNRFVQMILNNQEAGDGRALVWNSQVSARENIRLWGKNPRLK
jgi:hypothetical protein